MLILKLSNRILVLFDELGGPPGCLGGKRLFASELVLGSEACDVEIDGDDEIGEDEQEVYVAFEG